MSRNVSGKCLCGAVTVRAASTRPSMAACHCDMCRAWTSGAFLSFETERGSVEAKGPVRTYRSSDWAERAFCETCGSTLWYKITAPGKMEGQVQLSAGLFDNAAGHHLSLELYIDRLPNGYKFAGQRRQLTEEEVIALYAPSDMGDRA